MPLDYQSSADLMKDPVFVNRIKVACLKYADYITGEPANTPAHSSRIRWAQMTYSSPDSVAQNTAPGVVMDSAVQQDGAAITDAALQSATENTINKLL